MKFRKKPVVIEATQWFKNGDHPLDYTKSVDSFCNVSASGMKVYSAEYRREHNWEGDIVRYYRSPELDGQHVCNYCGKIMHDHGWIDTPEGGQIVCPGDWIITEIKGEHYPCKPDIFAATYEDAGGASEPFGYVSSQAAQQLQHYGAPLIKKTQDDFYHIPVYIK